MNKTLFLLFILILVSGCTRVTRTNESNNRMCENTIQYGNWTDCLSNSQNRTVTLINCTNGSAISQVYENRVCGCISNWTCSNWTTCSKMSSQIRTCLDSNSCEVSTNKPPEIQICTFANPCNEIKNSQLKAKCNSLVYKNVTYCNSISGSNLISSCIYSFAYIYNDFNSCNLINDSVSRNTCKSVISLEKTYCNILAPEYRNDCYTTIYQRYSYLAAVNLDNSYCNRIEDATIKNTCLSSTNYNYYKTYKDSMNSCNDYIYDSLSSSYQTVRACYIYHITQSRSSSTCDQTASFIRDDCRALINQNLSFCYDKSGYQRDWCLANFMYYNNDTSVCRDATSADNCFYSIGYWFNEINYCLLIEDSSKRDLCINSYISFCESNVNNCPNYNYCNLITNDDNRKDECIQKLVENQVKFNKKEW